MRFSPFDFDVVTTPDQLPPRQPADPVPHPEDAPDHATAPDQGVSPADEKPK